MTGVLKDHDILFSEESPGMKSHSGLLIYPTFRQYYCMPGTVLDSRNVSSIQHSRKETRLTCALWVAYIT